MVVMVVVVVVGGLTGVSRCLLSPAKLLQKVCEREREKEERMRDKEDAASRKQQIGAPCYKTLNLALEENRTQILDVWGQWAVVVSIFLFNYN